MDVLIDSTLTQLSGSLEFGYLFMRYSLLNSPSLDRDDKPHVRPLLGLVTRKPHARIVRIFGFVDLSCTDGSGCQPRVNGTDRMFSFLNLDVHG